MKETPVSIDLKVAYENYLKFRDELIKKIEISRNLGRSEYWRQEVEQFEYIFDATPTLVKNLRHHCFLLTGIRPYEYLDHHKNAKTYRALKDRLHALRVLDLALPVMSERDELGGFGFNYGHGKYNVDTLKFHEMHLALKKSGALDFENCLTFTGNVIEIGAGWGGFAETFLRRFPNAKYLIVDLPEALIFSGTLLTSWFPEKNTLLFDRNLSLDELKSANILLIANSDIEWLPNEFKFDLLVNSVSFQEMTSKQVKDYIDFGLTRDCKKFYSFNKDRSNYNDEIESVRKVLAEKLNIREIDLLKIEYTTAAKGIKRFKAGKLENSNSYRHVFGSPKPGY